jgi:MFS family permease
MTEALLRAHSRTFASLRKHRNYRLFFGGQVVSVSGTWMQNIATAWLVLDLTHSPVAVGILAAFQFLPYTLFGLFAGVLVDRLDVRRTVIATQVLSMGFAFALAALTLGGVVTAWEVYLLTGLRGTVLVLDAPSRQALTYQMVGRDELPNAVALNSSLFNAARVVGPAVGGLIVAAAGPGTCFLINGLSFVAVLAGLLLMRVDELFPVDTSRRPTSLLGGTADALAYVRRTPMAMTALVAVLLLSTFSFNFNVLLPVLARTTLDAGPNVLGGVRGRRAPGRADLGVARPGQHPRPRGGDGRLRRRAAPARARELADRRVRTPLRDGAELHAVDVERQLHPPAGRPRPPPRARRGPVLLRLQRHRPGRRDPGRVAGRAGRHRARVRRLGGHRGGDGGLGGHTPAARGPPGGPSVPAPGRRGRARPLEGDSTA